MARPTWLPLGEHRTDPAGFGDGRVQHLRALLLRRTLGLVIMAVVAPLLGLSLLVSAAVLGLGSTTNLLTAGMLRRTRSLPPWIHYLDLLLGVAIIAMEPAATLPAVAVMVAIAGLAAAANTLHHALGVLVFGVAILTVSFLIDAPEDAALILAAFGLGGLAIVITVAPLTASGDRARARLDATLNNLDAVLWVRDPSDGRFAFVNERATTMLGWPSNIWEDEVFWSDRLHPEDRERAETSMRAAMDGVDQDVTYRFRAADDRWVHLRDHMTAVLDDDGELAAVQGMSIDVTEIHAAAEALTYQALYDGLTDLPNRRLLEQHMQEQVDAASAGSTVALLLMDLDQFKEVNDALGHHVGDRLLTEIGRRLSLLLDDAFVARLGGDEFAVVLHGDLSADCARERGWKIRRLLAEAFLVDDVLLQTNASIGIASFPEQAGDVETLLQRADVAMYQAKRAGTGVVLYAPENDRSSIERLTLIAELPRAIDDGELVLHFQPTIDLRTDHPVRVEALVRWRHPELGLLAPDRFIELAELSGSIGALTRWVIGEAITSLATCHAEGHHLGLALNLSVRNLYDPTLVDCLAEHLRAAEIAPALITLELTETELMDDPSLARQVFTAFSELGVSTSIDDFGTGYSSLTYLLDLPLQEIKIDRSFVSGLSPERDEFTIVRSLVDLGHNLGLSVVAEGVEQDQDLTLLKRLGCDLAQGFHLSHPLPMADLLDWLRAHRSD